MNTTTHPSYQAWSYAGLLQSFNATIEEESIFVQPCAYLHNYAPDDVLTNEFYSYYIEKAPLFLKPDAVKLREFIKRFMRHGDRRNLIARIENGKIRPSKSLADSLRSIMKGNQEFIMIDDQKVVYEEALWLAAHSNEKTKNVLIIEGGPGTGKSVVAVNLLVELNRRGLMAQYVTKTSAPREVYFDKLSPDRRKPELKNLFVSSGSFMSAPKNSVSALIVDEAHRLTEQTGFLKMGENQVKEIINTATFSAFFIDEDQRVHINDYAESWIIEEWAAKLGAKVTKLSLASQFRCAGSDGYLAWLDNLLQIRETANENFLSSGFKYDFRVVESPSELRDLIYEKNKVNNKARLVAGYCWDWKSAKDAGAYDITFPEYDFQMRWNLKSYGSTWIIDPNSVKEVGCIHTCQGLEVDYIGVIIGEDLIYRDGQVLVDPTKRSKDDKSIFGYKKLMKDKPEEGKILLRAIIKNTYRTLMTRGMKGCYVYCEDEGLREYIRDNLAS
ncbi:DNA/RNA helicase domain-containing protein [Puia sp. P3]|uniref:DNA/RNA helicase domain-containing protein n=1 Tax=Puia sp. P3 TaxID=3423952 RepID=UPI003D67DF8F